MNINGLNSSPFLPPLSPTLEIFRSESNIEEQKELRNARRKELLLKLAGINIEGSLEPEPARTDIPELGNHACCDTKVFEIAFRILCNPWRLTKDLLFGCFVPCALQEPQRNTYVTKHAWEELTWADVYVNRNTCLLCCITPTVISTLPFAGFVPLATKKLLWLTSFSGCASNDWALFNAGCLTYFWSGDFGGRERLSYDEMKILFDDEAKYLADIWQKIQYQERTNASSYREEKEGLQRICELVRRNSRNIVKGIINSGITPMHADYITRELFDQIAIILEGTRYDDIANLRNEVRNDPRPSTQPLIKEKRAVLN